MVLSRRSCHVIHIGDTRAYRLSDGRLERLTTDHVAGRGDLAHLLNRAIGFEDFRAFDYTSTSVCASMTGFSSAATAFTARSTTIVCRFCSTSAPGRRTARTLVDAALAAGSTDNMTALVLDVVDLPPADRNELTHSIETLPILDLPSTGETVDDFALGDDAVGRPLQPPVQRDRRQQNRKVVLKFPHPRVASEGSYRLAFVREAWVAARVRSLWIGRDHRSSALDARRGSIR